MPVRLVAILALSTLVAPASALAQGGIRFDAMSVGCEIHGRYDSGEVRVETYVGRKGKTHVTRSSNADGPVNTQTYDARGRLIRKDWAGGKWETFAPFSCFSIPGACTYRYRNADGADATFVGKVVAKGDTLVSTGGFDGDAPFNPTTLTLGPFNNVATFREGSTSFKVIEYRGCHTSG